MVVGARSCAGQSDGILAFSLSHTPHTEHTHYILLHYTRSPHPSLHSHSSPFSAPSAALDLASRRVENTRSQKPFLFSPNIPSTRAGSSSDGSRRAAGPYTPDDFLPPQPSTRSAIPQLVVHRPSTSLSSIASSIGGVFRPGSARQQQQQQHRQDVDQNQEREEIVEVGHTRTHTHSPSLPIQASIHHLPVLSSPPRGRPITPALQTRASRVDWGQCQRGLAMRERRQYRVYISTHYTLCTNTLPSVSTLCPFLPFHHTSTTTTAIA